MDFDKLTNQTKQALQASQQILQRYKHTQLDVEHVLLALLEQPEGVVRRVLQTSGVDAAAVTAQLERELGKRPQVTLGGGGDTAQIYITPHADRVLTKALEVAGRFGDQFVAAEHILLAVLEDGQTEAARILTRAGLNAEQVLRALQQIAGCALGA